MTYSEKVLPILRKLRPFLLPHWGNAKAIAHKGKMKSDAVTALDVAGENLVAKELKKLYPGIGFVGEECGGNRTAKRFWLMDPLDGTSHYMRGLPFCTSMLALIEEGQVNFAAIYDFINDHIYWAERGGGAFKDGARLRVSSRSLSEAYTGWETHVERGDNMRIFLELKEKTVLFKCVSAGWEFAMIAEGKLDARVCFDPWGKDYDFAPGSLLVSEAGGVVANLGVRTYNYTNLNFIAANSVVYKELTEGKDALFPVSKKQ